MILDFEGFNEEFIGIDFTKVKKAAYDFYRNKECKEILHELDSAINSNRYLSKFIDFYDQN